MSLQDLLAVVPSGSEEQALVRAIDWTRLPRHVAIIMDGNGRWARLRHKRRVEGHRAGIASVRDVVETSARLGLQVLTLYAFSIENWKRPKSEVSTLMALLKRYLRLELDTLLRNDIRFQVIGRMDELPDDVQKELQRGIDRTVHSGGMLFNIALNYGGRAEITDAVRRLTTDLLANGRDPSRIDEALLSSYLYTAGQPDPDLLIRTSGELRISNFLLWQIAYAEIWVTDVLWPDFRRRHLLQAIADYQKRERRYGGIAPAHRVSEGGPPTGRRSELFSRIATAVVVLPLLLAGMLWAPPVVGLAIVTVAVAIGAWEFDGLLRAREVRAFRVAGALGLVILYLNVAQVGGPFGYAYGFYVPVPLLPLVALLALTAVVFRGGDFAHSVPAAALTLLGAVYLGGLGGAIAGLRIMPPMEPGPWRIVLLLAIVMAADTAAYFVGRALGRHKLAPAISPGKTVEGAMGGVVGGVLGAWAVSAAGLHLPGPHVVILGVLVTLFAIAGDLFESLLKRWAGVKDSGRLFPGHGGMLDRLDSLLFGAAVLYYYFSLFG